MTELNEQDSSSFLQTSLDEVQSFWLSINELLFELEMNIFDGLTTPATKPILQGLTPVMKQLTPVLRELADMLKRGAQPAELKEFEADRQSTAQATANLQTKDVVGIDVREGQLTALKSKMRTEIARLRTEHPEAFESGKNRHMHPDPQADPEILNLENGHTIALQTAQAKFDSTESQKHPKLSDTPRNAHQARRSHDAPRSSDPDSKPNATPTDTCHADQAEDDSQTSQEPENLDTAHKEALKAVESQLRLTISQIESQINASRQDFAQDADTGNAPQHESPICDFDSDSDDRQSFHSAQEVQSSPANRRPTQEMGSEEPESLADPIDDASSISPVPDDGLSAHEPVDTRIRFHSPTLEDVFHRIAATSAFQASKRARSPDITADIVASKRHKATGLPGHPIVIEEDDGIEPTQASQQQTRVIDRQDIPQPPMAPVPTAQPAAQQTHSVPIGHASASTSNSVVGSPEWNELSNEDRQDLAQTRALQLRSLFLLGWEHSEDEEEAFINSITGLFSRGKPFQAVADSIDAYCEPISTGEKQSPLACFRASLTAHRAGTGRMASHACPYCKRKVQCYFAKPAPGIVIRNRDPASTSYTVSLGGQQVRWILKKRRSRVTEPADEPFAVGSVVV